MNGWSVFWHLVGCVLDRQLKCRVSAAACVGLEALGVICSGAGPFLLKTAVDLVSAPKGRVLELGAVVALFVVTWTIPSVLSPLRSVFSTQINSRLVAVFAAGATRGFLSDGAWRNTESGKVQSLIKRLPYSLAIVVDGLIWRTVPLAVQVAIGLVVIFELTSWTYVLALGTLSAGFVIISWWGMKRHAAAAGAFNRIAGGCGSLVGDVLRNPRRIVSNGAVSLETAGIQMAYLDRARAEAAVSWALLRLSAGQWIVVAVALTLMLGLAGEDVERGRAAVSDFILLQAYAFRLVLPLAGVAFILSQSATAFDNLADVMALQEEPDAAPVEAVDLAQRRAAKVEVRKLSFHYPGKKAGVADVSVVFPPGSFSVIVGKNGAGKSTLAQLLAGLLPADAGSVTYDGLQIDAIPENVRHREVLYVPQRVSLLNRDLRSNLFYPPSLLTEVEALRRLTAWEFHDGGEPLDLAASVGEGGEALSGGQVQKLELARLLGINVPCLILDESTSALNPAIEARIIAELRREVGKNSTLILVAHRLAISEVADQVVWMEAGRLQAVQRHEDLMSRFPAYCALWKAVDG